MTRRVPFVALLLLVSAVTAATAAEQRKHTIVIRDGKTIIDGEFHRTYLGISSVDMTNDLRDFFGAPKDSGVLVQSIAESGPAAKAGVRVGDVITAIDGKPVDSTWDVSDTIGSKKSGESVRVDVIRGRAKQTLMATLEERDLSPALRALSLPRIEQALNAAGVPGWRARVEADENCTDLQTRIKDLETRLRDLEKKLQK